MLKTALLALALAFGGGAPHLGGLMVLMADAVAHLDPNGAMATSDAGNNLDPNGATSDAGNRFDPDGATSDAGNTLDPDG
jgi:hypothetical protein